MNASRHEVVDRLHSAALHLVRAARSVDGAMGLTPARASALSVLVFGGPRTVGELARAEGVRSPTMTALVSGLEADGLVRRSSTREDGRKVVVEATPRGRKLLERGRRRRLELLDRLLGDADAHDLGVLSEAADLMERAARRLDSSP